MAAVTSSAANQSPPQSTRMSSPRDAKKPTPVKPEDTANRHSPPQPSSSKPSAVSAGQSENGDTKLSTSNAQPLAPPPKPSESNTGAAPDYFTGVHNNQLFNEPNPFEQSFGNQSVETPGKTLLPPVNSLTSPASLLPAGTPSWQNSLRSGPLSPAMLSGPTGSNDYFGDHHLRGSFPTPNESSLRTGLTPGGGGSMFPAPSPNSQALFNSLQSGGATPSTLDFHRTAMNARAAQQATNLNVTSNAANTSAPEQSNTNTSTAANTSGGVTATSHPAPPKTSSGDPFGQHDANDAAHTLSFLAQANGVRSVSNGSQYTGPQQPGQGANQPKQSSQSQSLENSPSAMKRNIQGSVGSISVPGVSEGSEISGDDQYEHKPATRSKNANKKGGAIIKGTTPTSARRKAEDTPPKQPSNKKSKTNGASSVGDEMDTDDEGSVKQENPEGGSKKMTDEEKRKNFLERNRVAALKCRQRKKQWLANLQAKVEIFSSENDALSATVGHLREEIIHLKAALAAHKDCPVAQAQGLSGMTLNNAFGPDLQNPAAHANPYGMAAMQNQGIPQIAQQQGLAQRR